MNKKKINRLIMLNQMAGPLFRELAEDLAPLYENGCILMTGHPDTIRQQDSQNSKLVKKKGPTYNRSSKFRRVQSWLSYVLVSTRYILSAKSGDAILLVSNPPILGPWVWLLTRFNATPYCILVYDIHPEVLIRLGALKKDSLIVKLWRIANRLVNENAELIVTIGSRMATVLDSQNTSKSKRVVTVSPWVDTKEIRPIRRSENPFARNFQKIKDKIIILYSGNMGASHDIDSMLEAARLLKDEKGIQFIFIGDGEKRSDIKNFIQKHRLRNISLLPFQSESMIKYSLPIADISLVSLDQGMEDLMVPSKSFYYLSSGSALIAIANKNSELSDVLDQSDCGILVPPGKPFELVGAIRYLVSRPEKLAAMKNNARVLAVKKYSREVCTLNFSEYLRQAGLL